jgi:hypothetical protein
VIDTRALVLPWLLHRRRPSSYQANDGAGSHPWTVHASLTDAFREIDNLTTFRGAVVSVGMHGARAAIASLWLRALTVLAPSPSRGCGSRGGKRQPLMAAILLLLFAILGDGT